MNSGSEWALVPAMFTRPRRTIATIVADERYGGVPVLAMIGGCLEALQDASVLCPDVPLAVALVVAAAAGAVGGLLVLHVSGWLVGISGRWFGGRASGPALRAALAWGRLPVLAVGLIFLAKTMLVGWGGEDDLVRAGAPLRLILVVGTLNVAILVLAIWSLITSVAAISQVQAISPAKTVASLFGAGLIASVMVMAAITLIAVLRG